MLYCRGATPTASHASRRATRLTSHVARGPRPDCTHHHSAQTVHHALSLRSLPHPQIPASFRAPRSQREAIPRLDRRRQPIQWRRSAWSTRTLSWLILGESSSKERFAVVDAVPTPTPTPLLDAIRARAEICVLRTTLSAEMACGACAANVMCLELDRVCTFIDLVLSSSIDHTVRLPVTPSPTL